MTAFYCVCGQAIPEGTVIVGIELAGDHDPDTNVFFHSGHALCLDEWDLAWSEGDDLPYHACR